MHEKRDLLNDPLLLPVFSNQMSVELRTQLATGNYLSTPAKSLKQQDQTVMSNQLLWDAVLSERFRSGVTIKLENFFLFEWFPRSPGLYYTNDAKWSRESALEHTFEQPISSELKGIDDATKLSERLFVPEFMRLFDPDGKYQMLRGGIGSIRLKDKAIDGVGRVWFMAASSTNTAHEGFPIALPDKFYQRYIDQITMKGVAPCTITGKLRFVPDTLGTLYQDYTRVPQLYLLVEDIKPSTRMVSRTEIPRVSVAVMFRSDYREDFGVYSSYVTFFPSQSGSLASRVDWLENTYVKSMYKGQILIDFDEQNRRFETAEFSLQKVFDHQVSMIEVNEWDKKVMVLHGSPTIIIERSDLVNIHAGWINQMTNQEKVINIGNNNSINAPIVIADDIQNSFNVLNDAQINDEARKLLEELLKAITDVNKNVPPESLDEAKLMVRDAETLVKEAASSKPRRRWYEVSLDGLKQAAINIGEIAGPVLKIVEKLTPILIMSAK